MLQFGFVKKILSAGEEIKYVMTSVSENIRALRLLPKHKQWDTEDPHNYVSA